MTDGWSPMIVIRPDTDTPGTARLEDSSLGIEESVSRETLARQIATGSAIIGSRTMGESALDSTRLDWVSKGWRPSLEYFDWSEGGAGAPARPSAAGHRATRSPAPPAATAAPTWQWDELAGAIPAAERTVGEILVNRKTIREYDAKPFGQADFARILHDFAELLAGTGGPDGFLSGIRFAAIVYAVDGLTPGVWHLDLDVGRAELTQVGQLRQTMSDLMCGMQAPMTASATVVLIVDLPERQQRYPYERALRELYLEVGRIAQWLILACEFRGAGCLITPATNDLVLSELLGLPAHEVPVYTVTFGLRTDSGARPPAS